MRINCRAFDTDFQMEIFTHGSSGDRIHWSHFAAGKCAGIPAVLQKKPGFL
ncbi:MAG: hypothetical protein ACM37W_27185 [Actinomycetota bacterium]